MSDLIIKFFDKEDGTGKDYFIVIFHKEYPLKKYLDQLVRWREIIGYDIDELTVSIPANNEVGFQTDDPKPSDMFDFIGNNKHLARKFHKKNVKPYTVLYNHRTKKTA